MYLTDNHFHHPGIWLEGTKKLKEQLRTTGNWNVDFKVVSLLEDMGWSRSTPTVLYHAGLVNTIIETTRLANSVSQLWEQPSLLLLPCLVFQQFYSDLGGGAANTGSQNHVLWSYFERGDIYLQSGSNASFTTLVFPDPYFPGLLASRAHSCRRERWRGAICLLLWGTLL